MLNISLPEQVQSFVEEQAKVEGFNSPHEYIYQLILREQARVAQQNRVEVLLLEGLDSGEAIVATDDWWEQKRTQLVEQFQQPDA
ncbi:MULTISPECIES: type II toxin-antitoxin system ParD family antitoxin [unclassified Nostoc]|uniref:ribbon-helix-helix domain-containing protein n=1 Tax=unclassified Nostoc TaxID=2593658 RepID=UPI0013D19EEC|nr:MULTISPECIES: type II toxin-antitoxin system ParD family antitoxin [unclassified Nostoc]MBE8998599.1 type II toxin-antitoxin system ParD family antitoxin [Nostoc sp. LEGE 12447]NEU80083.1 type II toxin-antitoxin system ParD family antitoxin [Nostoc sp. UIC 10630]